MGTWGSGPFDNDDAADWAWQLRADADEQVVAAAIAPRAEGTPRDAIVVAAAEVVAAAIGRPHPELPDEVMTWVMARQQRPWVRLVPLAVGAVERLRGGSGIGEAPGEDALSFEVDDLLARLRSD